MSSYIPEQAYLQVQGSLNCINKILHSRLERSVLGAACE